ncbi:GumC family protein [Pedobacter sp. AW1-32]|uniref:GumC family protein n=1 Tax=Pedobacter sp. AW1-32 TaxID=3383026 RepID=UPI003FF11B6B
MNINSENKRIDNKEKQIELKSILTKLSDKWHWFLFSVCICLLAAFFYIKVTPPMYLVGARVLVSSNEDGGGMGKQSGALMDLSSIIGGKNSVDNEAEILKTRFLMEQVVRKMQLNISYSKKEGLVEKELYFSPFKLVILNSVDTIKSTKLTFKKLKGKKFSLSGKKFNKITEWNKRLLIPGVGEVLMSPPEVPMSYGDVEYFVSIKSIDERVNELSRQLVVEFTNKKSTIIDLNLSYGLPKKGEDILNALISQYISTNLEDKNIIADSTTQFIRKRLNVIATELGDVENKVEGFKRNNNLADMTEQGKLLVQSSSQFSDELAKAETQVTILSDLENYLRDESKNKRVFPASLLPQDMVFSGLMNQYNALLIERDKQLLSVTETSPFVRNVDEQIASLRQGILANIQSTKNTFVVSRDKLRKQLSQANSQISGVPEIEKDYLQLARNQKIKQELYIFLMQKAEETAISKTSNISIAKTIDPPKSAINPISPKKRLAYATGTILGLLIPIGLLFLIEILSTSVSSKEDIVERTSVPIIGEISHNSSNDNLVVVSSGRSAISEQFRALRTNLSFFLKGENGKIILLTSSMSGEGKSFTAINLASILALSGKKVLLMELDLRKPGLSSKLGVSNDVGFSNYSIDPTLNIGNIIKPLTLNQNMFIISSGPLPPNPAETLIAAHIPDLIKDLKQKFDYILMDAPPIGIITDAQLLADYSDAVIYLVRQGVTQKDQIQIVDELYTAGKLKNMGIVVNDIVHKHYGYGYGYGSYGQEVEKSTFRKVFDNLKKS